LTTADDDRWVVDEDNRRDIHGEGRLVGGGRRRRHLPAGGGDTGTAVGRADTSAAADAAFTYRRAVATRDPQRQHGGRSSGSPPTASGGRRDRR